MSSVRLPFTSSVFLGGQVAGWAVGAAGTVGSKRLDALKLFFTHIVKAATVWHVGTGLVLHHIVEGWCKQGRGLQQQELGFNKALARASVVPAPAAAALGGGGHAGVAPAPAAAAALGGGGGHAGAGPAPAAAAALGGGGGGAGVAPAPATGAALGGGGGGAASASAHAAGATLGGGGGVAGVAPAHAAGAALGGAVHAGAGPAPGAGAALGGAVPRPELGVVLDDDQWFYTQPSTFVQVYDGSGWRAAKVRPWRDPRRGVPRPSCTWEGRGQPPSLLPPCESRS